MDIHLDNLPKKALPIAPGDIIFCYGDLGAGKTTFIQESIRAYCKDPSLIVQSPTYTYYRAYPHHIYHFDLYRLNDYETFIDIGGEEIFENENNIIFVEWPEKLEDIYIPTKKLLFEKTARDDVRRITELPVE